MAKSTTVISLPQMVDLALNSPEVGIVNFTVLHSLLHVIVNQLDLGECNVEFRGSDSERLQNYIATAKPGPIITLTEYTVGPDGKERKRKRGSKRKDSKTQDEKGQKDENQKEKEIAIIKKEDPGLEAASSSSFQTIVVVEPASKEKIAEAPRFTIALTKEQLAKLQADIKSLQQQVRELTDLPGNIGLIEALRSSKAEKASPLLDMFQILTLVKRLDATEEAMNKLVSMMEDLAKEQANLVIQGKDQRVSFKESPKPDEGPAQGALELLVKSQQLRESLNAGSTDPQIAAQLESMEKRLSGLEKALAQGGLQAPDTSAKKSAKAKSDDDVPDDKDFENVDLASMPTEEAIAFLQKELVNLKAFFVNNDAAAEALKQVNELRDALMTGADVEHMPPDVKIGQIELKLNELKEQVSTLDTVYHQQFSNIQDKLGEFDKEVSAIWERINSGLPGGDASTSADGQNVSELYNKLVQLQDNMSSMSETAQKLLDEREAKQNTLDIIIEQVELLKTVKADREDLEDALADKADACQINRKVSHEQFDAACDEITKTLEEALDKFKKQEEVWTQALSEVQKEVDNKLDKMELTPLKDFINSKLKGIQDKMKKISAMKQEHEAAGSKSKYLRNVNCISCDAAVVMKRQTDITLFPKPYSMPAPKSIGPYLAFEMDQLRNQQKTLGNTKNLNLLENAMQSAKAKSGDTDHLCNRYCGGSHTVTTAQQRVMRTGHFMEQWGPEISPINETLVKGTDGHLYKGRDDSMLKALAAEKGPSKAVETPVLTVQEYHKGTSEGGDTRKPSKFQMQEKKSSQGQMRPRTSIEKTSKVIEPTGSNSKVAGE